MRRRVGRPLLRTAVVAGGAYAVGSSAARRNTEQEYMDADQNAQIEQLQQMQQQQAAQPYGAPPPPAYAPPPPSYAPPSYAPPPPPAYAQSAPQPTQEPTPRTDPMAALRQLGELKAAGVISQEEFDAKKAQLLSQI